LELFGRHFYRNYELNTNDLQEVAGVVQSFMKGNSGLLASSSGLLKENSGLPVPSSGLLEGNSSLLERSSGLQEENSGLPEGSSGLQEVSSNNSSAGTAIGGKG
jgi:hypothetical protein